MSIVPHHTDPLPAVDPATTVSRPRLRGAVETAQLMHRSICVVHIDLDRFHQVNQRWGQQLGDQVLEAVGRALLQVLPDQSVLAATEGDAFVAMVPANTFAAARSVAEALLLAVRRPVVLGDLVLSIEASAGFAHHTRNESPSDLLEQAFLACRRAKANMRGSAIAYEDSLGADAIHRLHTEDSLRTAVAGDELRLHVQPTVDLRDGRVVGVEALVRWQHPTDGLLPPAEFLPLAESAGLTTAIGDWVLAEALRLVSRWRVVRVGEPLRIWVNLAAQQLADGDHLYAQVRAAMDAGLINAHDIGFEVTESSLLEDLPSAVGTLSALRGLGLEIALDDFGTGYSSLTYLQQLPVTAVKIDRSFVAGIGGSLADEAIVEAVIDLAHALGLRVIAEGIEDLVQSEALIRMGADEAQGYHFSYPMPAEALEGKLSLPWCGSARPRIAPDRPLDRRADELPGFGSARARLLLTALDTVRDSILVTSAATGSSASPPIVYVNPAFEAETGFRSSDVVGQTVEILHADRGDAELTAWFRSVRAGAAATTREIASQRADGSTYLCEVTLSPILDERGIHTHWLHVRSDLTQRRIEADNRARFQGLIEQSLSLVAIVEGGGKWVYANSAQRSAIGLGPDDPLEGALHPAMYFDDSDQGRLVRSEIGSGLQTTGRWSGPISFTNPVTGMITEVMCDIHPLANPLRPGVTVYAAVSRDMSDVNALESIEQRRRELFGFASKVAQRTLANGRDEPFRDFDGVLAEFGRLFGADFAYVDVIDTDKGILRQLGAWRSDRCAARPDLPATVDLALLPAWIERLGEPGLFVGGADVDDGALRTELAAVSLGNEFGANICTGLKVGGVLVGAFGLSHDDPDHRWSDDELATMQQVADTIANLLGRERSDQARRAGERHVSAMLSNVRDILVVIDRDGWVRYINPQIEVSTGHRAEDVVGKHFLYLVHPDDAEMAVERFTQTLAGVPLLPMTELRIVLTDGSSNWYDLDTTGFEDPVLGGYVVSLHNVSTQHAAAELADRRREFEQVLLDLSRWALNVEYERISDGLAEHLEHLGRVLHADTAGVWLLDGHDIHRAARWTDPQSGSNVSRVAESDVPAMAERLRLLDLAVVVDDSEDCDEPWAEEWNALPGHERSALLLPLASAGTSLGLVGVTMTSTARTWLDDEIALVRRVADTVAALFARQTVQASLRASEARLAALLDGSLDLVIVVTESGDILYVNAAVRRSLGYVPEDIIGVNLATFVHDEDRTVAADGLQALAAGEVGDLETLRVIASDGSFRWVEVQSGVIRDPIAGGMVLTCRDITERHAAEVEAAKRVSHLRYAFEVAQSALDLDPEQFLGQLSGVCVTISTMLGVDLVYVDRVDEQRHRLTNLAGCVKDGSVDLVNAGQSLPFDQLTKWVEHLRRLEPVIVENAAECNEPWAVAKRQAMGSEGGLMAVAMSAAGELFGVLGVSMLTARRVWTDDELTFLRIIAETIAHVLERARMDSALRRSETRFRLLSDTAADVVLLMDSDGVIQYASPSSADLLGLTPDELLGRPAPSMVHPENADILDAVSSLKLQQGAPLTAECRFECADGTYVWVAASVSAVINPDSGLAVEYRASLRDISERKRLEVALKKQALHDPLTGLGNRILLQSRLVAATQLDPGSTTETAVLLIDLDGFKAVNDTFGHAVGDEVLRIVAARLQALTREQDTLARTGGDEFVVICPGTTAEDAVRIGQRIVDAVSEPLSHNGTILHLGASVGVAHHVGGTADPLWLMIAADHAMYSAKREGRGRVSVAGAAHATSNPGLALGS